MPLCKSIATYIASAVPHRIRKVSDRWRDVSMALKKCGRRRVRSLSLTWAILFTTVSGVNNLVHHCWRFGLFRFSLSFTTVALFYGSGFSGDKR